MIREYSKASILGALSQALDLVEGQSTGHALRTALLSFRIGSELRLYSEEIEDLYFTSVLKDSGCSNNSARIQKIFGGDELISKREVKLIDWSSPVESIKFALKNTERGNSWTTKLWRLASNLGSPSTIMRAVTEARCARGSFIAQELDLGPVVSGSILFLDEHWDGHGAPYGVGSHDIPLVARIVSLAQTFDVFLNTFGLEAAREIVAQRSGTWFDPELVKACLSIRENDPLWPQLQSDDLADRCMEHVPWLAYSASSLDLNMICEAFALIIDAKSPYTVEHSDRVAGFCNCLGECFGFSTERLEKLRQAALIHNIADLGVSNASIDQMIENPSRRDIASVTNSLRHSEILLKSIPNFEVIADVVSSHHERIDGSGYWRGLRGPELSLEVRIVSVCDAYDRLTSQQAFRKALHYDSATRALKESAGIAFDEQCVEALIEKLDRGQMISRSFAA
jgi:HD-GYP domain-containing protein (c-di-GMP phosphodiesterase class II)